MVYLYIYIHIYFFTYFLVDLNNIDVNIEMYVFTWPLPSQCIYQEANQIFDSVSSRGVSGCGNVGGSGADRFDSINSSDFTGNFSNKNKNNFNQAVKMYPIVRSNNVEDVDDIFEQPIELIRQIPVQV